MANEGPAWKLGVVLGQITTIERAYYLYMGKSEPIQVEAEIAADNIRSGPKKALAQALQAYRSYSRWLRDEVYDSSQTAKRSRHARNQIEMARFYYADLPKRVAEIGELPAKLKAGFDNEETSAFCADVFLGLVAEQSEASCVVLKQAA